jgi:hypothetical protein
MTKKHFKSDLLNSLVGKNMIGNIRHKATRYGYHSLTPFQRRVHDAFEKEFPIKRNKGGVVTNNFKGVY